MTTPSAELAVLLRPLEAPCSEEDLAEIEAIRDRIREARRGEDPNAPLGVWQRDRRRADWQEVLRLSAEVLSRRAKDLLVAVWLAEAWTRLEGFEGLARGIALLDALCADHWDKLLPPIEGGDVEARLAPIEWLNERLPGVLGQVPLLRPSTEPGVTMAWSDHLAARRLETLHERDANAFERAVAAGAIPIARVLACRQHTPTAELLRTVHALRATLGALASLSERLAGCCGPQAPSLARIRGLAEDILAFLVADLEGRGSTRRDFAEPVPGPAPPDALLEERPPAEAPAPASRDDAWAAPPATREEAYRRLSEIAEALHRLEPQSPVPYLIEQALEWGQMPLPQFLAYVMSAGHGLAPLFALLGLGDEDWTLQSELQTGEANPTLE